MTKKNIKVAHSAHPKKVVFGLQMFEVIALKKIESLWIVN